MMEELRALVEYQFAGYTTGFFGAFTQETLNTFLGKPSV